MIIAYMVMNVLFTLLAGLVQDMLVTQYRFRSALTTSIIQSAVLFALSSMFMLWHRRCATTATSSRATSVDVSPSPSSAPSSSTTTSSSASVNGPAREPPLLLNVLMGAAIAGNMLLTNRATVLLSYPVQVMFKSSKLLLAIMVRTFVFGRSSPPMDWVAALMLCIGLACFMIPSHDTAAAAAVATTAATAAATAAHEASASTPPVVDAGGDFVLGVLNVVGALFAETAMLNIQEHYMFRTYNATKHYVMMHGYLYCCAVQVLFAAATTQIDDVTVALRSAQSDPALAVLLLVYPALLFVGVLCLLHVVDDHGSVAAAASNVIRKLAGFVVSYLYFARPLTPAVGAGAAFVFSSILLKTYVSMGEGEGQIKDPAAAPASGGDGAMKGGRVPASPSRPPTSASRGT